jgi:hypothetical protein
MAGGRLKFRGWVFSIGLAIVLPGPLAHADATDAVVAHGTHTASASIALTFTLRSSVMLTVERAAPGEPVRSTVLISGHPAAAVTVSRRPDGPAPLEEPERGATVLALANSGEAVVHPAGAGARLLLSVTAE